MSDPIIKTIGTILKGKPERDAIHVAILPAKADEPLVQGTTVTVDENGLARHARREEAIGIVDPFLPNAVDVGQRFWVFIFPGTVTGMRHHFELPAIDGKTVNNGKTVNKLESESWLRAFAAEWNFDYDTMIDEATAQITKRNTHDGYDHHWVTAQGIDLHSRSELGADEEKFWYHIAQLTGLVASPEDRESFGWSCSC